MLDAFQFIPYIHIVTSCFRFIQFFIEFILNGPDKTTWMILKLKKNNLQKENTNHNITLKSNLHDYNCTVTIQNLTYKVRATTWNLNVKQSGNRSHGTSTRDKKIK